MSGIYRMRLAEFRKRYFMGKPPCENTLKKWIDKQELPGERIGNLYFVLVDARGEPVKLDTGNEHANEMLKKWRNH